MTESLSRRALVALVAAGAAAGVVARVAVHRSSLGALDGDEAVWGLMARHVLDGEVSAFFWGQGYGGTQEVLLTAPLFGLAGTSTLAMRLVPAALTALACVLVWRIGRRTIGEPAASLAGVLLWVWPPYLVWKSERAHGFYGSGLVLVCLTLLLVLRLGERRSRLDLALLGLVLGLGWWQTPQIVPIALPAIGWLAWRRPGLWRHAWVAVPPALVGALPWLVSNLRHDWWSFDVDSGETPYPSRVRGFFSATFPMAIGLRVPYSSEWLLGTALSGLLYAALVVALVVGWRRARTPALRLLYLVLASFPVVHALSPSTWIVDEPRYVVVLLPVVALLAARPLVGVVRGALAVAASAALSAVVLVQLSGSPEFAERADGMFVPREFGPLIDDLERTDTRRLFASYWVAYRLDFETRERIVAAEATLSTLALRSGRVLPEAPTRADESRHPEYDAVVRKNPDAAFVLLIHRPPDKPPEDDRWRPLLERAGYTRSVVDGFAIYRRR